MNEKKYLSGYQKFAYGLGDVAGGGAFSFVGTFIMIYLTNAVGLNPGIIGTLMLASKIFDGVSDIIFGSLIDRTKSKMGKARPWMFYAQFGVSICMFLVFAIPDVGKTMQYVYFFVFYTALNAVFYTANNIAYASLIALITKNQQERVQCGSIRFILSSLSYLMIASASMGMVEHFGGGTKAWKMVALIYAVVAVVVNTISVLSVKELPEDETEVQEKKDEVTAEPTEKVGIITALKLLVTNKYYLLMLAFFLVFYGGSGISGSATAYFCTYHLENVSIMGLLGMCKSVPMMLILTMNPVMVKKLGTMRKVNFFGFLFYTLSAAVLAFGALNKMIPLILLGLCGIGVGTGPMMGTSNALIAEVGTQIYHQKNVHLEGTMFSCTSIGTKIGSGIGSAIGGWLLAFSGFDGMAAAQPASAINMITGMYALTPIVMGILISLIIFFLKVEDDNKKWETQHLEQV